MPPADMRNTIVVAVVAAVSGFCLASVPALGALKYNIWSQSTEQFQLGYVIGYLDAVQLAQRKDLRANVPTGGGKNYERWVRDVNVYFAEPQNQARQLPDAMYEVGMHIRAEWLKSWQRSKQPAAVPSPSPAP
jgi:hypothetical protein